MITQDPLEEYQQHCRTCYNSKNNLQLLKSLPESWTNQNEPKTYAELLTEVCQIDLTEAVTQSDLWPQFICLTCCEKLKSAYDFIQQTHKINKYLKTLSGQLQTKTEHFIEIPELDIPLDIKMEKDNDVELAVNVGVFQYNSLERKEDAVKTDIASSVDSLLEKVEAIKSDKVDTVDNDFDDRVKNESKTTQSLEVNNNNIEFQCDKCKIILPNALKLKRHVYQRHCPHCDMFFKKSSKLKYHILTRHTAKNNANIIIEKKFSCKKCLSKFKTSQQLRNHNYRMHMPSECIFLCSQCGQTFEESDEFKKHMLDEHDENVMVQQSFKLSCNKLQSMDYINKNLLKSPTNESTHQTLTCSECHKIFATVQKLNHHKRFNHVPEDKKLPCHICNMKFSRTYHLKRHLQNVHAPSTKGEIVKKDQNPKTIMDINTAMHCNQCGKIFYNSQKFSRHQRHAHVPDEKKFVCHMCGQKFGRSDHFRRHMRNLHQTDVKKLNKEQCRACYNSTKGLRLLTNLTKCSGEDQQQKSYAELLKEVANINIMEDLYREQMPHSICEICIRRLKTAHTFIQQTQEVNERLLAIAEQLETDKQLKCLQEPPVDIVVTDNIKAEKEEDIDYLGQFEPECFVELKIEEPDHKMAIDNSNEDVLSLKKDEETLKEEDDKSPLSTESDNENVKRNDQVGTKKVTKDSSDFLNDDKSVNNSDSDWKDDKVNVENTKVKKKTRTKCKKTSYNPDDDIAVPCEECNKIFNNSKALARHKRNTHIPEEQKCTCPLCGRRFSRSCNMYKHMRTFHGPDSVPLIRKPSTKARQFQCDKCERNYTKKSHLNLHIKEKHNNNEEGSEKQTSNGEDTAQAAEEDSVKKDKPKKRYEVRSLCSICGSSFASRTHLVVHMRRHTGERPFKCDLCDRAYPRPSELVCHRRIHTGEKPFKCKICDKAFRVWSKMSNHMRSHTDIRPYKCTQCERSFKYSKDLNIHFRIHTGERPYKCNVCGSTFTQTNKMNTTEKLQKQQCRTCYNATKGLKPLTDLTKCGGGSQQISYAELLADISNINIMEDFYNELPQFICEACQRKLKAAQAFIQQTHEVNERLISMLSNQKDTSTTEFTYLEEAPVQVKMEFEDSLPEPEAEQQWHDDLKDDEESAAGLESGVIEGNDGVDLEKQSNNMETQIEEIEKNKEEPPLETNTSDEDNVAVACKKCDKVFNNSKALTRHLRITHIPDDQKCSCPICFSKFTRACSMYTHMRTFHGSNTVPLVRKPLTQDRMFQCEKCPKNYTQKKYLDVHVKTKHTQTIEEKEESKEIMPKINRKPLCSICGSSFPNKTHLMVHMRRHTGERPFKCDLCERAFPRLVELTYHRRIHTGEKPFECKICGKTFRVSSKMTTHMRSHTDIRPYKCTQCERSFKYSKDLNIHFRIHTGERPYSCNVCGHTFTQSNSLKTHRIKLNHLEINSSNGVQNDITQMLALLNRKMDILTQNNEILKHQMRDIKNQNTLVLNVLSENTDAIEKSLNKNPRFLKIFPISTIEQLNEIEDNINEQNEKDYIASIRAIAGQRGLKKGLSDIMTPKLLVEFNVDGSHNKQRLLNYTKFVNVLFHGTYDENCTEKSFKCHLRDALKLVKNRYFKEKCISKDKSDNVAKEIAASKLSDTQDNLEKQQCRACYNANKGLKHLTKCIGGLQKKSYGELLREVSNINIMDEAYKELPQFICESCSRKLKASNAFIQQTHEVNERLMAMLMGREEINNHLDCLQEAQVDIQSCLEIKMEHDEAGAEPTAEEPCSVALKLEEPEDFSQINHHNVQELGGKKDNEDENNSLELITLKETNEAKTDINASEHQANEDILNVDTTRADDKTKPLTDLFLADEGNIDDNGTCNKNSDSEDEDYQDDLTDDMDWQKEQKTNSSNSKKDDKKKITKKSRKSEETTEDDDVAVPCNQCNKIFNNSKALARHQRTSHIPEEQKCTCPLCFRKFSRSCNMYTHMRTFHGPDTVPLIRKPSTQERIFQCDKCPRNYTKKKHLNIHIKNKHSQENEMTETNAEKSTEELKERVEETPVKPNKPKRYEVRSLCSICGSSFSSKTHLIVHMRRHTGERPFKCDLCERAYPRISELTCHRRIHTGEKPFACKICGKTFRVSSKMTTHMRSHTDIRPYKCTQCERSFKYSKDLSIHFRIHTGERPYCCNVCGSTFTQSNTLKAHRVKLGHMDSVVEMNTNNLV
ncbi:hypothetical protein FF38_12954 [Lucilia cuprina]|uniref:Zinc finger protein Xfin n=1 Tax=Lucilia cuprina TaxID=7375 RepID=A0A0L0C279_LUCCU|nr:hypothetical protein FF38_12954 [Lucilia cuprina]